METPPEAPLSAEVVWDWDASGSCTPDKLIGVGSRIVATCRVGTDYGADFRSLVIDPATGEVVSDFAHVLPEEARGLADSFEADVTAAGGVGLVSVVGSDLSDPFALVLPLSADGASDETYLEIAARVALPRFEDGRGTFLSAPFEGGSWQLTMLDAGEPTALFDLGFAGVPLARTRLADGYGVLHSEAEPDCDRFNCFASIVWTRFDDAGNQLNQLELASDFPVEAGARAARLVTIADGTVIVLNTQAGVRWFRLDDDGLIVASPPVLESERWIEQIAIAPLSDGELMLGTIEQEGFTDGYQLRLLRDDDVDGPATSIPKSRPGGQAAMFEALPVSEGVLVVTGRYGGEGGYLGDFELSGVLVRAQ